MREPATVSRAQILAFRRRATALDERLPAGRRSLRAAAWAGLQDSMPRAALLSLHARVRDVQPTTWADPSLVQVWGPRHSAYVVAERDRAAFTLGRLPDEPARRERAETLAARMHDHLAGSARRYGDVGEALGVHHNALRYAAATGTVLIRWDGARQPTVWTVPAPEIDPVAARRELARRYLHVFGPATAEDFAQWAGIPSRAGAATVHSLRRSLSAVRTPLGDAWILARDEQAIRRAPERPSATRLLPSGDAYFLLQGAQRELLIGDASRRRALWTARVWPGALLLDGELRGTWRRADEAIAVRAWGRLARREREAVEAEAASLPIPGVAGRVRVGWV